MQKFSNETEFLWDEAEEVVGYTTIDNYICNNEDVEFNSQGIYLQIVKFKNSAKHKVYMSSLEKTGKGSRRDIQRGIVNLRMEGFIIRELIRDAGKIKGVSYKIRRSPLKLTESQRLEIYNESKINREYISKIYGKEYADKLEKLSIHCVPTVSTDYSNCEIANCEIANCVTKKENRIKSKIGKKENKDDDTKLSTETKKESSSSITTVNEDLIAKIKEKWLEVVGKRLILSHANKIKLTDLSEQFGETEVVEALNNVNYSDYLKEKITLTHFIQHFEKIARGEYNNHANISTSTHAGVPNKISQFNNLGDNSRSWDFNEIEELERKYIDAKLGLQ